MTKLAARERLARVDSKGGNRVTIRKQMAVNASVEKIAKLRKRFRSTGISLIALGLDSLFRQTEVGKVP